jgi:ankyrin repeat protein
MTQPDALKKSEPLTWSTGIGTDVWDLFCASIRGDLEMVKRLLGKDSTLARCHYNELQTAAAVFATNPALADDPDALANAAGQGHELFVRLMLRLRPDFPRRVAFPGWAVGAKTRELNELLFQHGMDPSAPDWLGITPLHEFARKGDLEKAAIFLDHGANLHARDEDICSTPLGWAAKFGQKQMVAWLLDRGVKPNLTDDPPWATPLAWAKRRGHFEIAALLERTS